MNLSLSRDALTASGILFSLSRSEPLPKRLPWNDFSLWLAGTEKGAFLNEQDKFLLPAGEIIDKEGILAAKTIEAMAPHERQEQNLTSELVIYSGRLERKRLTAKRKCCIIPVNYAFLSS